MGQTRVLWARQPVEDVIAHPLTQTPLRESLETVGRARVHAASLGLEVGNHYTSYVRWEEGPILTSVVATHPGSVEAAPFSYPVLGELPYKGFFDPEAARALAEDLRKQGLDVCISEVAAYSTLGWLDDPITTPMLKRQDGPLVELIVHELVHTNVFVSSDPDLNESVATFVGQEAAVSFFTDPEPRQRERKRVEDARRIATSLLAFRDAVADLYAEETSIAKRRSRRTEIEAHYRKHLTGLDLKHHDAAAREALAHTLRLNDACLALQSTYTADLSQHKRVLDALDGDLSRFVARFQEAAPETHPREAFFAILEPVTVHRNSDASGE